MGSWVYINDLKGEIMRKSKKQENLEEILLSMLSDKAKLAAELVFQNEELQALQDYANIVSIKRLGYNDHGPVHMRTAAYNAVLMFNILNNKGIKLNLEAENIAKNSDSLVAVFLASFLHDIGMCIARDGHELNGMFVAQKYIDEILDTVYEKKEYLLKVAVKNVILEGIMGHMASKKIHTLEAGLVLVGDGCDMAEGRARITTLLRNDPKAGDIHRYSASSIEKVIIEPGNEKPIRIHIKMNQSVGIFQVEEVLYPKILNSPIKPFIELYAQVDDLEMLRYL